MPWRERLLPVRMQRVALVAWSALVLALAAVPIADSYRSAWTVGLLALAAALPFGLVAPLGVLVPCVVLGALCLVATDRIALRAGRADRLT